LKRTAGRPTKENACHNGTHLRSDQELALQVGDSARSIQRYIRLTELIPELLDYVDNKKIGLVMAVDLSYLDEQVQKWVYEYFKENGFLKPVQVEALKNYPNLSNVTQFSVVVQDQVWGRVTENRIQGKSTRYYMDEMHLLLREDQTAAYTVEIWKRFRKWGGIPTGITQNVKDLLASKEVENIFENSDFIYMLNQAVGDRQILAKQLNISPHQLSYVTHSGEGD
jgi:hypothetical protein